MTSLTIVPEPEREGGWHVATVAELAALRFLGEHDLKDVTQKEIFETVDSRTQTLCVMSKLALWGVLRDDKDELVEKVRKDPESWIEFHEYMEAAKETAEMAVEFFTAASARMMVAMATVEHETPPDGPDGGEDLPEENNVEAVAA